MPSPVYLWPFGGPPPPITSAFGAPRGPRPDGSPVLHDGDDYAVPWGTPFVAPSAAIVWAVGRDPTDSGGLHVAIRTIRETEQEHRITACHLSAIEPGLVPGTRLARGQLIGRTGNTGHVLPAPTPADPHAGSHVHLMTRMVAHSGLPYATLSRPSDVFEGPETWRLEQLVDGHVRPAAAPEEVELVPVDTEVVDGERRISPAERALIRDEVLDLLGAIARATSDGRITGREVARVGLRLVDLVRAWRAAWRRDA